jgi:hypothetical protein
VAFLRSLLVILPPSGLLVAACSGSSSVQASGGAGGNGGSGAAASTGGSAGMAGMGGIPIGQAPVAIADAVCAKAFECCTAEELMALSVIGETEDQCRVAVAAFLGLYQVNIQASITAMRSAYDGVALSDCVGNHQLRTCEMVPSLEEINCAGAVVPLIPIGETCGAHHECIDGYCAGAGSSAATPTGTCTAKKADGEMCAGPEECASGACPSTGCGPQSSAPLCGG